MPGGGNLVFVSSAKTSRSGSLNGRDLSITPLTTLNSAVFAPSPNAIVIIATAVTPGFLSSIRRPNRTSRKTVSISASDEHLSLLIKLRLKQRLLFIIRLRPRAIECARCLMAKRASTRRLFFLSKTLQNIGATLVRLTLVRLLTDVSGDQGSDATLPCSNTRRCSIQI